MGRLSERNVPLSILRNMLQESRHYRVEVENNGPHVDDGVVARLTIFGRQGRSTVAAQVVGDTIRQAIEQLESDWAANVDQPPASEAVKGNI